MFHDFDTSRYGKLMEDKINSLKCCFKNGKSVQAFVQILKHYGNCLWSFIYQVHYGLGQLPLWLRIPFSLISSPLFFLFLTGIGPLCAIVF